MSKVMKTLMNLMKLPPLQQKSKPIETTQTFTNPFNKSAEQLAWERGACLAQDFTNKFLAQLEAKITAQLFVNHPVPLEYWHDTNVSIAYISGCKEMVKQELELWNRWQEE